MDYEAKLVGKLDILEPGEISFGDLAVNYVRDINAGFPAPRTVWIVTGSFVHPGILCAQLIRYPENYLSSELEPHICVWGYQYTRRNSKKGRFGSYGMNLDKFIERHEGCVRYFTDKDFAFKFLAKLVAHPGGRG